MSCEIVPSRLPTQVNMIMKRLSAPVLARAPLMPGSLELSGIFFKTSAPCVQP